MKLEFTHTSLEPGHDYDIFLYFMNQNGVYTTQYENFTFSTNSILLII